MCYEADWAAALSALRAAHAPIDPTSLPISIGVTGKRAGERFAALPSQALAGSVGAALSAHFDWRIELRKPELEVTASLNDDGLLLLVSLLRRPSSIESRTQVGLHPHVAWAMAKCVMSFAPDARLILDPMCGTGSALLELVGGWPSVLALGSDVSAEQLVRARRNRAVLAGDAAARLLLFDADSRRLPLQTGCADGVLADLPFGVQHGSMEENASLYPEVLREVARGAAARRLRRPADQRCQPPAAPREPARPRATERLGWASAVQ